MDSSWSSPGAGDESRPSAQPKTSNRAPGISETLGYALTATFTVPVVIALRRLVLQGWLALIGYGAARLIATGVVTPVVEAAGRTLLPGT